MHSSFIAYFVLYLLIMVRKLYVFFVLHETHVYQLIIIHL